MKSFSDLRLSWKLGLGFSLTVGCAAVIGFTGLSAIKGLDGEARNLAENALPRAVAMGNIDAQLRDSRLRVLRFILAETPAERDSESKNMQASHDEVDAAIKEYESHVVVQEDRQNFEVVKTEWGKQDDYQNQIVSLATSGKTSEARELLDGESRKHHTETLKPAMDKVNTWNAERATKLAKDLDAQANSARSLIWLVLAVSVGVSAFVAWFITRAITRPVSQLSERMTGLEGVCLVGLSTGVQRLAEGDLTYDVALKTPSINAKNNDELGQLCQTFDKMLGRTQATIESYNAARRGLTDIVGGIASASENVAQAANELSQASTATNEAAVQISQTITQVSSALEESARSSDQMARGSTDLAKTANDASAAMDDLEKVITQVRESSTQQGTTAESAQSVASEGGKVVELTVQSMGRMQTQVGLSADAVRELGEKQQQIGAIVQTIDEIAEQTNLLALNAAIEAARAGEHGRGFAVVADEVRKLAERSGEATKEIANLIASVRSGVEQAIGAMETTAKEVETGVANSSATGEALAQILQSVQAVQAAAKAADKLVLRMGESASLVTGAITQVASISQESASVAQELSATNEEVSASAEEVTAAVEEQTANIERAAAMSQQMSALAGELNRLVQRFTYEGGQTAKPSLRVAA